MKDNYEEMFLAFRSEIDRLGFPILFAWSNANHGFRVIKSGNVIYGFLMVIDGYVDSLYIKPEYRQQGHAKKAVLDYIRSGGRIETLHIVNSNATAKAFWFSIFDMHIIDENPVDTLYRVDKLKKGE